MGLLDFVGKLLGLGGSAPRKIELAKVSASAGLPIIYGNRKVKPITVFKVVSEKNMSASSAGYDSTHGHFGGSKDKNQKSRDWLHRIDVWGQGKITGLERFWIDGDAHTSARFIGRPYFRALSKFGAEGQFAASELVAGHTDWTSNHRGNGVAYTWARFYNSGKEPQYEGEPRLEAQIKGLRCYDPRTEAAQDFYDTNTWTYTENRALIVLNYLMGSFGFNAQETDLDLQSFRVAADLCDEKVTIPLPKVNTGLDIPDFWHWEIGEHVRVQSGVRFPGYRPWQEATETEQAKYAAGAVLDPKDGVVKNTKLLLEGMGWALPWSNGKHKLIIEGEVDDPVMHFDEDSIMGGWNVERGMRADRLNRVTVEFPNRNKQYQDDTVSWPAIGSDDYNAFKAEDQNQDLHTNQSAETITDFYRAQAYAEYLVRKSRVNPRIRGLQLSPKAMLLEPGDVISIYYEDKGFGRETKVDGTEYEGTLFIVERVDISAFLDVRVDLIKYDPTVYGAPALDQEPIPNSPYNPDWWREAPAPTELALEEVDERNADGTVIRGIKATWVLPEGLTGIASVEVEWKKSSELDYRERMTLAAGSEEALVMGLLNDAISYDVRVRYVTQRSQKSAAAEGTITMTVVQSVLDVLNDGQLVFADFWDFGPTAKGWTADEAVLDEGGNAVDVITTGTDAKLISPDGLRIDGSIWDKVIVRMKRQSVGDGQKWEQAYLYYNTTTRGGFDQRYREFSNARFEVGRYVTFVFDMSELSSQALGVEDKDDWAKNIITQIRFDPTITAGDHLTLDWIGIGRAAPSISAAHGQNLVSDLGFKKFEAVDTSADSNFTAKTLDAMNLAGGEAISAGIEVIATGVRRGRLKLEFLNSSDGVIETQTSPWSKNMGLYEQVKLEALYIPASTYRIRAWLEREETGSGAVGARYYTLNAGSAVVRYAPVRDDVQEGATRTAPKGQYDSDTAYESGDVVSHQGSSYVYIWPEAVAGKPPSDEDYWMVLASAGAEWLTGDGAPLDSEGEVGDYYLNSATGDVYKKGTTSWGAPDGNIKGGDGDKWFSGNDAPATETGTEGDRYLNKTTGDIYVKISGVWSLDGNIKGEAGQAAQWHSGASGPYSGLGAVGDFYLNSSNGAVYRKIGETLWSLDGNIKGKDGDKWTAGSSFPSGAKAGDNFLNANDNKIYTYTGSSWSVNFALTDNLGDLAIKDIVRTADIDDEAATDFGDGWGSNSYFSTSSHGVYKKICTLYGVRGSPEGALITGRITLRNNLSTREIAIQIRASGAGSASGEIITPVTGNTRTFTVLAHTNSFSGTRTYELHLRSYGAAQDVDYNDPLLKFETAKK